MPMPCLSLEADKVHADLANSWSKFKKILEDVVDTDDPLDRSWYFHSLNEMNDAVNRTLALIRKID